jgi:uncharacterized phage protein (TIGR01671 family)
MIPKFRAWSKQFHQMVNVVAIEPKQHIVDFKLKGDDRTTYRRDFDECIPLLYTGINDDSKWEELTNKEQEYWLSLGHTEQEWQGKGIYEGDIIKVRNYGFWQIKYDIDRCGYFLDNIPSCINPNTGEPGDSADECLGYQLGLRVIGNIYENPDLLKVVMNA